MSILPSRQERQPRRPPDRSSPVAEECQEADCNYVVSTNTVVSTGKINRRHRVGSTKRKERGVLKQQRGEVDLLRGRIYGLEGCLLDLEQAKERDIRGARL